MSERTVGYWLWAAVFVAIVLRWVWPVLVAIWEWPRSDDILSFGNEPDPPDDDPGVSDQE